MKILVLTSVYKDLSLGSVDTSTNIVNSFVSEWEKQGHEVVVVHNAHCYPKIIHKIPRKLKEKFASKMGFMISEYEAVCRKKYFDNGALIYRLPIKKFIPHATPGENKVKKQVNQIRNILGELNFCPDVILGHWASPQMEIIAQLKEFINCKTVVVLHGKDYIESPGFEINKYLKQIDRLGVRSEAQAKDIKNILGLEKKPFVCYSGVPDEYLKNYGLNIEKFTNIKKWKFAYVGRLIKYKNVDSVIKALSKLQDIDWELNIIGDGAAKKELEKMAVECGCEDRVCFMGKISRSEVMKVLKETHVFAMISTNEIFGLVYLEAMAASCITIASKDGGVDGIISNLKNGLLCKEADSDELLKSIKSLVKMNTSELSLIAQNGYVTASEFTDSKVAKRYLDYVMD